MIDEYRTEGWVYRLASELLELKSPDDCVKWVEQKVAEGPLNVNNWISARDRWLRIDLGFASQPRMLDFWTKCREILD